MAKLIGTAGHVDHGKTTLIRALTGIDADRLPDEKRRGLTIDVGFAFLDLPQIGRVSIVDVPGHEKFLSNMLVGALGIDVALLCVAADESVKPQTKEHLQILSVLPVEQLIVVLTRADLADKDMRELAAADVRELLEPTRFAQANIIPVSAESGENLSLLKQELAAALKQSKGSTTGKAWYLPIDRVFTVKGHGAVVTGTLAQGTVKVGDRAYIQPGNQEVRIRAIHWHNEPVETSEAGQRTALNLSGVKAEELHRGMSIGAPGVLFQTDQFDAVAIWVELPKHGTRIRVSIGADEAIGRIFLNDLDQSLIQLRLEKKVAAALDQPIIVRRYSPPDLICGARVLVPQAKRRTKGEPFVRASKGGDEAAIFELLQNSDAAGLPTEEICRALGKSQQTLGTAFEKLLREGKVRGFAGLWFSLKGFEHAWGRFELALRHLHEKNPTVAAIPRERVLAAAKLNWSGKPLDRILAAMAEERRIIGQGTAVRLPSFRVTLSPKQRQFLDRVLEELRREPVNTPNPHQISESLRLPMAAIEDVLRLGTQTGEVVRINEVVFYAKEQVVAIKEQLRDRLAGRSFEAGQVRDILGTSRKYVIPLLEYFDAVRFTVRVGDKRKING